MLSDEEIRKLTTMKIPDDENCKEAVSNFMKYLEKLTGPLKKIPDYILKWQEKLKKRDNDDKT